MTNRPDTDIDVTDVNVQLAVADLFGVGNYSFAKTGETISDEERQQKLAEHLVDALDNPSERQLEDNAGIPFSWSSYFGMKSKNELVRDAMTPSYNVSNVERLVANENQNSHWAGWNNHFKGGRQ